MLIVVLVRIFNAKFKYINFILLICAATFVFVSVSDIDRNISKYNYNKYIAGEIEVDFEHYISLGNAAVPELAKLTKGFPSHVNLIRLNEVKERNHVAPTEDATKDFLKKLESLGVSATIRRSLGNDIEGACGQLRRRYLENKG